MQNERNSQSYVPLLLGIGIGTSLAVFWYAKKNKGMDLLKRKVKEAEAMLEENWENSQAKIQELFGDANAKTQLLYYKTRAQLSKKLGELEAGYEEIDKKKYTAIIDDIMNDVETDRGVSKENIEKLRQFLVDDYRQVKRKLAQ